MARCCGVVVVELVIFGCVFLSGWCLFSAGQNIQRTSYNFLALKGTTVVTSSGNLTSQGRVTLLTTSHSQPILDLQGGSYVTLPSHRCLRNATTCTKGFTISATFRFFHTGQDMTSSRIYVFDSGSFRHLSGLVLFGERDSVRCVVRWGRYEWKLEVVQQSLVEGVWHQLHVSWHPVLGLTLWSGVQILGSTTHGELRQEPITTTTVTTTTTTTTMMKRPIPTGADGIVEGENRDGGSEGGDGDDGDGDDGDGDGEEKQGQLRLGSERNKEGVHLQVSGISIVEAFFTDLLLGGLDEFSPISPPHSQISSPPTSPTSAPHSTTSPPSPQSPLPHGRKSSVRFLAVAGQEILMTSLGIMTSHGNVTLEPVGAGLVLVLNGPGEFLELGYPLRCLRRLSSCTGGFFFRIILQLLEGTPGFSVLLSSGGDQPASSGVTLAYSSGQFIFVVQTNTTIWTALYTATLQPGLWYTLDASWDGHSNTTMYINNLPLPTPTLHRGSHTPGPPDLPSSAANAVFLGTGPGYPGSTTTWMKVYGVDFWPVDRALVSPRELELPTLPEEPMVTASSERDHTGAWQTKEDPSQTHTGAEEDPGKLSEEQTRAEDSEQVVIIVLSTITALLFLLALLGSLWCWRSRRQTRKLVEVLSSQQHRSGSRSLSVDYAFRSPPRAYHARSFAQANDDLLY